MKPLSPMGDRGQRMDRLEQPWKMRVLRTLINLLKVCTCLSLLLHVMTLQQGAGIRNVPGDGHTGVWCSSLETQSQVQ